MNLNFLDFEQPILEFDAKIEELSKFSGDNQSDINILDEITKIKNKRDGLIEKIFSNLSPWQISQISRHPLRPYTLDYIENIFTDFQELKGDRAYGDDCAIVGGLAKLNDINVMVIGHQKGRDVKEKVKRNFAMPKPEGYRKALRLMKLAEKFNLPIITFIDTPGAYPGIGAEERGQSEAIATNLKTMSALKVPIICTVIGEGGSGGALAIGVADIINMLEYATYSVISPEGCATILWKSATKAPLAAQAMGITSENLLKLKLIDDVIKEPQGSAHRNLTLMSENIKKKLHQDLGKLIPLQKDELINARYQKLMNIGY